MCVARTNEHGVTAVGHLHVHVGAASKSAVLSRPPQAGDYSAAQYEVVAKLDQRAPMRDGIELMVDIFRPQTGGRFPAVLLQTPYNKSGQAARAWAGALSDRFPHSAGPGAYGGFAVDREAAYGKLP